MGLTQKPDSEPIFLLPPEFSPLLERHYRWLVVLGKGPHYLGSIAWVGHGTVINEDRMNNDNYFCRPVASPENVTELFAASN